MEKNPNVKRKKKSIFCLLNDVFFDVLNVLTLLIASKSHLSKCPGLVLEVKHDLVRDAFGRSNEHFWDVPVDILGPFGESHQTNEKPCRSEKK